MNFFKTFLAAFTAFIAANVVLGLLTLFMFVVLIAAGESTVSVRQNSILHLDLKHGVSDSPRNSPFSYVGIRGIEFDNSNTLFEVVSAIENATYDSNIKGIYINTAGVNTSLANVEEIRNALESFKETSGKFIVSYADYYSHMSYYLASVADRVYMNPQGTVEWHGLASGVMFFKGALDKLGVKPQILRQGTFKSAVEPFMYDKMSPENRLQYETLVNSTWDGMLTDISRSRNVSKDELFAAASELRIAVAGDAVENGFVDALLYKDQMRELLVRLIENNSRDYDQQVEDILSQEKAGPGVFREIHDFEGDPHFVVARDVTQDDDAVVPARERVSGKEKPLRMVSLPNYIAAVKSSGGPRSRNRIAIVYIDGDIVDGEGSEGAASHTVAEKIRRARKDERTKAVVLRVTSPGGSALASEVMWREIELLRKEKPVIVSQGVYAASGGYYVSCPGDVILADKATLTGSIGVFGLLFDVSDAMRDKLGVTVDMVRTNPYADMGTSFRSLQDEEYEFLMKSVREVYDVFVDHVCEGRNMTYNYVDSIGQGRIWSGTDALRIGLVDGIGGLTDAIELAASRAGISKDYRVWEVVEDPDSFTLFLRSLNMQTKADAKVPHVEETYAYVRRLLDAYPIQALLPVEVFFE